MLKMSQQVTQCMDDTVILRQPMANIVTPNRSAVKLTRSGNNKTCSYGKWKMSSNDSPRANVPPAEAVSNIEPHAAKPDAP